MLKNTIIDCEFCGGKILVKPIDFEKKEIKCSHIGCGKTTMLEEELFYYDTNITENLASVGFLVTPDKQHKYPLRMGKNVVGTSSTCEILLDRILHNNKCFISRRHCTIEVTFDKWTGKFRYNLQDGAIDLLTNQYKASLNGTYLEELKLKTVDMLDINNMASINLGGLDKFILESVEFPKKILETYKISLNFDPDRTQ